MWREEMRKKRLVLLLTALVVIVVAHAPEITAWLQVTHAVHVARRMAGLHLSGGTLVMLLGLLFLLPIRGEY